MTQTMKTWCKARLVCGGEAAGESPQQTTIFGRGNALSCQSVVFTFVQRSVSSGCNTGMANSSRLLRPCLRARRSNARPSSSEHSRLSTAPGIIPTNRTLTWG